MTLAQFNAVKPGDAPPKDEDRVLLYNPSPKEIVDRSNAMIDEYKENVIRKVKDEMEETKKQSGMAKW